MDDSTTTDDDPMTDRWRGALLGTALGDAVGAPFEGRSRVAEEHVRGWIASDRPLTWTDDTAMTIGLARSLVATGGRVDPGHLGDTFAAAYRSEPWRGYGAGPPRIFAAVADGGTYLEAAAALFDGGGSFGNGAAMRAAPAGVVGAPELDRVARIARTQARVTHAHPLGQDGAALLAMAVATVATPAADRVSHDLLALADRLETGEMRGALRAAVELGSEPDPRRVATRLGHGVAAVEAVPAAIAAFLGAPDDPVAVLVRAVTMGGDTDTIAAMAGALAGARVGARQLPSALLQRLEARDQLVELADRLAHLRPG